ncbi:MAG: type II secretion system protein GspD [Gammaproteobacteria bacterium]|nr:MAG: type II secretion system protein GspD [Gammaproteobacteria bacterium]
MKEVFGKCLAVGLLSVLTTSCSTTEGPRTASAPPAEKVSKVSAKEPATAEISGPLTTLKESQDIPLKEVYPGSGGFVNASRGGAPADSEGEVTLNFQNSPIAEVVKTILGDILGVNFAINDAVTGTVSMRTARPVAQDALIPVLDNLLRMNGAAIVKSQDFYEIVPIDEGAISGLTPSTRLSADRGYQMLVVPLQYIGAKEMARILEPVKSGKAVVQADEFRNLLMLAGTHGELFNLRETVAIFDVDQLQGMSVGLFRMQNVDAATMLAELETIFGDKASGPLAGMVRFTVMERLNALLVLTPQRKYLEDVEIWVKRLDQAENPHGMNMYVYYVQNGKAENLADLLNQLFEGKRRNAVAMAQRKPTPPPAPPAAEGEAQTTPSRANEEVSSIEIGDVTIIPDTENNALLVLATPTDYAEVEKAMQKLDVLPMQVLVEASIVEVTLDHELQYGLQWFLKNTHGKYGGIGGLNIPRDAGNPPGSLPTLAGTLGTATDFPNFTYAIFDAAGTRALLNAVSGDSRLDVLSSPSLMVLDNQTATIRVGDQVPIRTSETSNVSSGEIVDDEFRSNITSQIQYRDTGVTLEVTPRVNAGGMVMLDITQRVDDVSTTTSSTIDSPTILQREITTSVAVQSGETIVLGGLIREDKEKSDGGIPFLKDIPIAGYLFKGEKTTKSKTELVVMITPSAVANPEEARQVTEEYKSKLQGVDLSAFK